MVDAKRDARVLVVDDEPAVRNSCVKTLTLEGCTVDSAENGEEGLAKIQAGRYDLVVTDLKMPRVDGMQLLRTVKSRWPEVNVVMITAYGTLSSAVEAIKLRAFDYLPKPFTCEELAAVAARALALTGSSSDVRRSVLDDLTVVRDVGPADLERMWCMPEHSWARTSDDGSVVVGLDAVYRRLLGGDIEALELARAGQRLAQGEACARMVVARAGGARATERLTHTLWCPVSGTVATVNEEACRVPALVMSHPYSQGWLLRLAPSQLQADLGNLRPFADSIAGRVARKNLGLEATP